MGPSHISSPGPFIGLLVPQSSQCHKPATKFFISAISQCERDGNIPYKKPPHCILSYKKATLEMQQNCFFDSLFDLLTF